MVLQPKSIRSLALLWLALFSLLVFPRVDAAAGAWSVVSLPHQPGEVISPTALAVDALGNLYVADGINASVRIERRDLQGNWSVLAAHGATALAVDTGGDLYAASGDLEKRDGRGNWSVIAAAGHAGGQVTAPTALAVDPAGNLYVADSLRVQQRDSLGHWSTLAEQAASALAVDAAGSLYVADQSPGRIRKRDTQGNWSVLSTSGMALGQVSGPTALAVDPAGNLFVADQRSARNLPGRVQERDAGGNWSLIATVGTALGDVVGSTGLAVDTAGNLYVTDQSHYGQIQKRDAGGNWSLIASGRTALGPVISPVAVAVDAAGHLSVADQLPTGTGVGRVQQRDLLGNWSLVATAGAAVGEVSFGGARVSLAADAGGNLYVAEGHCDFCGGYGLDRIQQRDPQGNWSVLATQGSDPGQVYYPSALAVDTTGNLYVAAGGGIQKRDSQGSWSVLTDQGATALAADAAGDLYVAGDDLRRLDAGGNWSVIAPAGSAIGQVSGVWGLAVDATGNLYVADGDGRIQRRDAQGNWSVLATNGAALGPLAGPTGLAVDGAGNLYVADTGNDRVLEYTPAP